jgi:hypothetical protein
MGRLWSGTLPAQALAGVENGSSGIGLARVHAGFLGSVTITLQWVLEAICPLPRTPFDCRLAIYIECSFAVPDS